MGIEGTLILLAYGGWSIAAAWLWRYVLPRFVFRFDNRLLAVFVTYVVMAASFVATVAFLDLSGWEFKGMNERPIQQFASGLFFLSPFGLPLFFGAPIVLLADGLLFLRRRYWEPIQ
ncbi:hypothetical protein ACI5KX_08165 [Erythrobacter sp. GH1-10]|uniref:hypothetical protein n=1 Tax=Erythrobacter sp. GH1-10 TaxID=3349334 RepID=UPI003877953A